VVEGLAPRAAAVVVLAAVGFPSVAFAFVFVGAAVAGRRNAAITGADGEKSCKDEGDSAQQLVSPV
jgi:hypothetical protein